MSDYWKFATQSDSIIPIGGGLFKGDWPIKMRNYHNVPYGDGPFFPTTYTYQKINYEIKPPSTNNSANFGIFATWNNQPGNITSVGTNGISSFYDTYDQSGNVWEWTYDGTINEKYILRGGSSLSRRAQDISKISRIVNSDLRNIYPAHSIGFRVATKTNPHKFPNFVKIADTVNTADTNNIGRVDYNYNIGKFCVTNIEYIEFLQSVASRVDSYGLFDVNIESSPYNGIIKIQGDGFIRYTLKNSAYRDNPVVGIEWPQAARFCNWLHNNKPRGFQNTQTTEDGAYTLLGAFGKGSIIEDTGNATLKINENFYLTVQDNQNTDAVVLYLNNLPMPAYNPDWDFVAAENINGTNYIALRYKGSLSQYRGYIHIWTLNSSWKVVFAGGFLSPNNSNSFNGKTFSNWENDFGTSFAFSSLISANQNALYYIPTEDEWYKAAYYNPSSKSYFNFATRSNTPPIRIESSPNGNGPFASTYVFNFKPIAPHPLTVYEQDPTPPQVVSSANYDRAAKWGLGSVPNITTVGTNGPPSFYGTYDQSGNGSEFIDNFNNRVVVFRGGNYRTLDVKESFGSWPPIGSACSKFDRTTSDIRSGLGGFRLVSYDMLTYDEKFVEVGNPNNPQDNYSGFGSSYTNYGSVSYEYKIGKYPVTVCEYLEFLNSVGRDIRTRFYNLNMRSVCRIIQTRVGSSFEYLVDDNRYLNKPIQFVSITSAASYCNWLYNNKQSIESGPYVFASSAGVPSRNNALDRLSVGAFYIPTEDEWYKAAFYDPITEEYSKYATKSNDIPSPVLALSNGDGTLDGINPVNQTTFQCI